MNRIQTTQKRTRFSRFSLLLTAMISSSFFAFFVSSYHRMDAAMKSGFFGQLFSKLTLSKSARLSLKTSFSLLLEQSFIATVSRRFVSYLLSLRLKALGTFLFTFGFFNCVIYVVRRFLPTIGAQSPSALVLGSLLTLASLPLFSGRATLADAILQSRSVGSFLEHVAGFRPAEVFRKGSYGGEIFAFLTGIFLGALSILFSPFLILFYLSLLLFASMILFKPEFGCTLILIFLPFISGAKLAVLIVFVFFSYLIKVLRGKRTIRFELLDAAVLLFSLYVVLSGFFAAIPSSINALKLAAFLLSYFLFSNVLRGRDLLRRYFYLFSCSISLAALLHCSRILLLPILNLQNSIPSSISYEISPSLLLCAAPITLSLLLTEKSAFSRFVCLCFLLLHAGAFYLFSSLSLAIAALGSLCLLLLFHSRKFFFAYLLIGIGLCIALPLLPGSQTSFLWEAIASRSSSLIFSSKELPSSVLIFGIGLLSPDALHSMFFGAGNGSQNFSLYTQLFLSVGFVGMLFLLVFILFALQKSLAYFLHAVKRPERLFPIAPLCAALALLAFGIAQNFLTDPMISVFLMLFAFSSSSANILSREDNLLS